MAILDYTSVGCKKTNYNFWIKKIFERPHKKEYDLNLFSSKYSANIIYNFTYVITTQLGIMRGILQKYE